MSELTNTLTSVSNERLISSVEKAALGDKYQVDLARIDLVLNVARKQDMSIKIMYDPRLHDLITGRVCEVEILE